LIIYKILILLSNAIYSVSVLPLILSTPPEPDNLVFTYTNEFSMVADNCLFNISFVSMECVNAFPRFDVSELD